MKYAIINNGEIRCPICGKKVGCVTGKEEVKNFHMRCPRKLAGKSHEFIIDLSMERSR